MKNKRIYLLLIIFTLTLGNCTTFTVKNDILPTVIVKTETNNVPTLNIEVDSISHQETDYQLSYITNCDNNSDCVILNDVFGISSNIPTLNDTNTVFLLQNEDEEIKGPILSSNWSKDGNFLIFDAVGFNDRSDIFIYDYVIREIRNLTKSPEVEGNPQWAPDGDIIYYLANTGDPEYKVKLFSINPDGSNKKQVTQSEDPVFYSMNNFAISPDGKKIIFSHSIDLSSQMFISNLDGTDLLQLTDSNQNHYEPIFSPDGKWILFIREDIDDSSNLVLINLDTNEELAIIIDLPGWKSNLSWSPNGDWITFVAKNKGMYKIYIVRPDGTNLSQIVHKDENSYNPSWRTISQ